MDAPTLIDDARPTKLREQGFKVVEILPAEGDDPAIVEVKQGKRHHDRTVYRVRTEPQPGGSVLYSFAKGKDAGGEKYVTLVVPSGRAVSCTCKAAQYGIVCKHKRASELMFSGDIQKD